jgi:hypothetical protein
MRRGLLSLAGLLGALAAAPLAAQYEQSYELRDGFGHNVQLRRPERQTPLITYDLLVRKDGKYFWSGPLTISVDNRTDQVVLQQAADCDMIILALAGGATPPAGAQARDYRAGGAVLVIGLKADTLDNRQVRYFFRLELTQGEPAPNAKGDDRCESEPWQSRRFEWNSQFAAPTADEFEIAGREGFTVRFRRRPDA